MTVEVPDIGAQSTSTVSGLSASIGAAVYPDNAEELTDLLLAADTGLYAAKNSGRDRVVLG